MYIPQIKDKHSLVDLTRYGTRARKHIHPDVLIGNYPEQHPLFKEGDILDGNATFNLIQCAYDQDRVYKILSSRIQQTEEHINDVEEKISDSATKQDVNNAINEIVDVHNQDTQSINSNINQIQQQINSFDTNITQIYNELNQFVIENRFVYDGLEENLIIIK